MVRLNKPILFISLVVACVGSCTWHVATGQDAAEFAPRDSQEPGSSAPPVVSQRSLETFYLERSDGSLKPFFNIPFEEWDDLYKLYKGLQAPDQPPRFLLRDLRIAGDVQGDIAFCTVTANAISQRDGWVRIPLRLHQAVIVPDRKADDARHHLLEFEREGDGLVWRVQGKSGQRHSLTVRIAVKLHRWGGESVLELSLPNATTSRFELVVPQSGLVVDAGENAFLLNTSSVKDEDMTRIVLDGVSGPLRLLWRKQEQQPNTRAVITAEGAVRIDFENRNREQEFRASALLHLSLSSGEIDSFLVRLPPGMQFFSREEPGIQAKVLKSADPRLRGARKDCQHVEFRLPRATSGPIDVRLLAVHKFAESDRDRLVEVGGFEVIDAVSQTGTISLAANSDWSFEWSHSSAVEQVEEISDALRRQDVFASFNFHSQPYSLKINVSRKENRVHVEPRYRLTFEPDRVLLDATLSYRLRGATTQAITMDFSGWQVEAVAIGGNNLLESPTPDTSQPLRFSLAMLDQTPLRDFDLTVSAVLYFAKTGPNVVPLPAPVASSHAPAQVSVRHVEQVEVSALPDKILGLTKVTSSPAAPDGNVVTYRGWGRPQRMVYAADVQLRPPHVLASTEGTVTIAEDQIHVRQIIAYQVKFQAVPRLLVKLPKQLVVDESMEILLDDVSANWTELSPKSEGGDSLVAVELPSPQTGTFHILVAFSQTMNSDTSGESRLLQIPLAAGFIEGDGQVTDTTITVGGYAGRDVEVDESWTVLGDTVSANGATLQIRAARSQPIEWLHLKLSGVSVLSLRDSTVEVAWLQTWLTESRRSDRLAVKLATTREQLRFRLPNGAELEGVAVDQRQMTGHVTQEAGDVIVRLPPSEGETRVVEMWYSVSGLSRRPGQHVLDLPQIIDADWTRRFYWQLVLPRNEHFLFGAGSLTREAVWDWRRSPFGRRPRFEQLELERLVGTSQQLPLPEMANQYLFSSQGTLPRVQFTTASRGRILFVTGIMSFVIGLLFIYVSPLRHPASLLGLAVVFAALGAWFPQQAVQIAQLSTLGILFVLVAYVLKRILTRTRTGPAVVHGSSLSSIESGVSESMLIEGASETSTQALVISHDSESLPN